MSEQPAWTAERGPAVIPRASHIVVPRRHGEILMEPAGEVLRQAVEARRGAAPGWAPQDPWSELAGIARRELFETIGRHAAAVGDDPPPVEMLGQPWIITGHQCEFYHAGVWAKVLAADRLASVTGGCAIDLIVDHDRLVHPGFAVPVAGGPPLSQRRLTRQYLLWDHSRAVAAEMLPAPQGDIRERWLAAVRREPLAGSAALSQFLDYLAADHSVSLVDWLSGARRRFEKSLGLKVWHAPCSGWCSGVAWTAFALAWMRQPRWAEIYNAALDCYRQSHRITRPGRPIPDLLIAATRRELPFWIYSDQQPRQRLFLEADGPARLTWADGPALAVSGYLAGDLLPAARGLQAELSRRRLRLRPRALTLTLFARTFQADLFIHGIGGALYDRITDEIWRNIFGPTDPPAIAGPRPPPVPSYGCVSAGWLLPLGQPAAAAPDWPALRWRRHHWGHNPQLWWDARPTPGEQASRLLEQRTALIARIAESLHEDRRRGQRRGRASRSNLFQHLHSVNARLRELFPDPLRQLDERIAAAGAARDNAAAATWREYFFALHPPDSLRELLARIQQRIPGDGTAGTPRKAEE